VPGRELAGDLADQGPAFMDRETIMEPQTNRRSKKKQGEALSPKPSRKEVDKPLDKSEIARRAYALF
jgi:hypothetical protein